MISNKQVQFLQPTHMNELLSILSMMTDQSAILAGGTDLMIKIRGERPIIDQYLSLYRLNDLRKIVITSEWLKVGAMVTHIKAMENNEMNRWFRALVMSCSSVGSAQVRNQGTLGGNIMNGSVASDIIPCLSLYNGELEFLTLEGKKRIKVIEYIQNRKLWQCPNKVLTYIYLPIDRGIDSCFLKLGKRDEVTIAQISLSASWRKIENKKTEMQVVMGSVSSIPIIYDNIAEFEGVYINESSAENFASMLRERIENIRNNRKSQSRTKITEAEQLYKERAVKSIVFDLINHLNCR